MQFSTPTNRYFRTALLVAIFSFAFTNAKAQCTATADFTSSNTACQTVQFSDLSTTALNYYIISWLWEFDDPSSGSLNTSTLQHPVHIFSAPGGSYNVSLVITADSSGISCTDSIAKTVILPNLPTTYFSWSPEPTCLGDITSFYGTSGDPIVTWSWNFGDGGISVLQNPEHVYSTSGIYNVQLQVTDVNGCLGSVSQDVTINPLPVANFVTSSPVCSGDSASFIDLSTSPNGYITQWIWDFGDGSSDTINFPDDPNVLHLYENPGTYMATLTVMDSDDCNDATSRDLTIVPAPIAAFNYEDNCFNQPIQFTDLSTTNGGPSLVSWYWEFDDPSSGSQNTSTLQNPVHLFSAPGTFDVMLEATNTDGCANTTIQAVHVSDGPMVSITVDEDSVYLGTEVAFFGNGSIGTIITWSWDFDDGTFSNLQNPTHTYQNGGIYNVSLTVVDTGLCQNTAYAQVFVFEPPTFPEDNAIWNTVGDNSITSGTWRFRYGLIGDTILSPTDDTSYTYSQVYSLYDSTLTNPNSTYFAAIRSTDDKKVYALIPGFPETLLYDFSLEIGDTAWFEVGGSLCYNNIAFEAFQHVKIVTDIDSIQLTNGEYRKRWFLDGGIMNDEWVDGVGSIVWFGVFNSLIFDISFCGDDYSFACFKEGNTIIYQNNPQCDACFCALLTAIEEASPEARNNLNIFPNPATNTVSISSDKIDISSASIHIYNAHGQIIYQTDKLGSTALEVNVSKWEKGVYIIRVINESQNIGSRKLVVR